MSHRAGWLWPALVPVLILVLVVVAIAFGPGGAVRRGENDFLAFYCGGKLLGTGQLYDAAATLKLHQQLVGKVMPALVFIRLPVFAVPYAWLAKLPYLTAYGVFQLLSVAALVWALALVARRCRELGYLAAVSLPLLCALGSGQEVTFLLLLVAGALAMLKRRRDFWAGVLFALCALKFHLFVLVAVGLLIHRRWRVLAGGAAGGAALVLLSYAVGGPDWPRQYLGVLFSSRIHPNLGAMGNLRGLLYSLGPTPGWLTLTVHAAPVLLFVYLAWREADTERVMGYALLGGLLAGWHAYIHDFALLLVVYSLLAAGLPAKSWRLAFQFVLLPFLYYGLIAGSPYNALLPLALIGLLVSFCRLHRDTVSAPLY